MTDVRNMRKLMEAAEDLWAIEALHESDIEIINRVSESTGPKVAFALYASDDGMGRFPGWEYIKDIVIINDLGDYQDNKASALEHGVDQGIIDPGSLGFYSAYHIEDSEIDALRNIVAKLEGL